MPSQHFEEQDDDVVVIEERDKRTHIYICLAVVLGLAFGGLVGMQLTASQWQDTYQSLQSKYQDLLSEKALIVEKVNTRQEKVDYEIDQRLEAALQQQSELHQAKFLSLTEQTTELEKVNLSLESQVQQLRDELAVMQENNQKLERQVDMQTSLFARSRELFQREVTVAQELEKLQLEREELMPKIASFKKACDVYLKGNSWDSKSDSCDKMDEANSRVSHIDQMVEVYRLDLKQIQSISEELGL